MYYESRQHQSRPVADAAEASRIIKSGQVVDFHALIWKNAKGQSIAAVNDGSIDDPWSEVAVINLDTNRQIESITFPWCSDEEAARYLLECQEEEELHRSPANLPLDGQGKDQPSTFSCACCGTGFTSTIAEQAPHDQDHGFGYCPSCLKQYINPA